MVTYTVPQEMSSVLTPPVEGEVELEIDRDDARFDTLNDAIEKCTTFYSEAQSIVGKVGLPFPGPEVQPTNAVELFVQPFSGDWNKILACGDAVKKAGDGLIAAGTNLGFGTTELFLHWEGQAATAFSTHMAAHAAVYAGAGAVVRQGQIVFEGISEVAQFIAGLVVELIDTALDIAVWLIEKIARYGRPWIGWVQLGWDVIQDGWDAIQDIIDTMWSLVDTIKAVFDLHEAVTAWVDTIPAALEVFSGLVAVFQEIPAIVETPVLTAAQIRNGLNDLGEESAQVREDREKAEKDIADAEQRLADLEQGIEKPEVPEGIENVEVPEVEE
ncbi:hypothetical protein ACOACO_02300 [Nocardioides sp. CPCC 205120]|uniref:hypothetical protein n=1 Tax=Nocardioides sp. CPCC 205120 TaxID=3406462 RepID=UPI003B506069